MVQRRNKKNKKKKQRRRASRKNIPLQRAMKKLVLMGGKKRQDALRQGNNVFIRQLATAVRGVRRKRLPNAVRSKLTRHRSALRSLANPSMSFQSKRKVLVRQKGGFFGAILASLTAPLIGIIAKAITGR